MDCLNTEPKIEIKEELVEENERKVKFESMFPSVDDTQSEVLSKKIKLEADEEHLTKDSSAIFSQVGILKSPPQDFEESYEVNEEFIEERNYELQTRLQNCSTNGVAKFEEQRIIDGERSSSIFSPKGTKSAMQMASRGCKYSADAFCYVCGEFIKKRAKKYPLKTSVKLCEAYNAYFGMPVGDQDKEWAPHVTCELCRRTLEGWYRGEKRAMQFAIPRIWGEPTDHLLNCFFCMVDPTKRRRGKHAPPIKYPDIPSSTAPVPHSSELPVPIPPKEGPAFTEESSNSEEDVTDASYNVAGVKTPYFPNQEDINDLIRDLGLTKSSVWSHKQTLLLLSLLEKEKEHYKCTYTRNKAFENIYKKFIEHDYTFSLDDIKRKWRNLTRTYRTTRDKCKQTGEAKQTWPYYDLVREICSYEDGREITQSEMSLIDSLLEEEKSPSPSDLEAQHKQVPNPSSRKRKTLRPCTEICFKEYALESVKILKSISTNMNKISENMSVVKKSLDENTLTMSRLCATMERFINGVIVINHNK